MPLLERPIAASDPLHTTEKNVGVVASEEVPAGKYYNDWPNDAAFHTTTEEREKRRLAVTGRFPAYTAGRLFRTGPQAAKAGDFALSHWFDGFTTVHRFDLAHDDGGGDGDGLAVHYAAKCQVDRLMEQARKNKNLGGVSFAQKRDPCDTYFNKVKSVFQASKQRGEPNVGVTMQRRPGAAGAPAAMTLTTDAAVMRDFDPDTLEPKGVTDQRGLHPALVGPMSAAHASFDPETGDIYNFNLALGAKATYRIFRTDARTGATEVLATVADSKTPGSYIHSLFVTQNFVVLCVWPASFANKGLSVVWEGNILDAMRFDAGASCHWLVVDRRHGRGLVRRFTSPAMFCFHTTNAFERPGAAGAGTVDLVCELVQFPNTDILHKFYYTNLMSSGSGAEEWSSAARPELQPKLTRYALAGCPVRPPQGRRGSRPLPPAEAEVLSSYPACGELPTINPAYATKPHRFVYGIADTGKSTLSDGIVKTDAQTGAAVYWRTPRHSPGEPIFVARPDGTAEDDGVLLSVVLDGPRGTSYLLCLDARDLSEVARAEVEMPVQLGFHGAFVGEK